MPLSARVEPEGSMSLTVSLKLLDEPLLHTESLFMTCV